MSLAPITTALCLDNRALEAVEFYISLFENAHIVQTVLYGETGMGDKDSPMMIRFELEGQSFEAMNLGPMHTLNPALSIAVNCDTQAEIDRLWDALLADGGKAHQCGWLTDRFGVSWQINPTCLIEMRADKDPRKAANALKAMGGMIKLDIQAITDAYNS